MKIINDAKFIYTDFNPHFDPKALAWNIKKPRLYQHTELIDWIGLPMFAKDFELNSTENIVLSYSALGIVEIYINGKRVGGVDEMKPGWTDYRKRTLYDEYDISEFVKTGKNRILAVVGGGWYSGRIVGDAFGANPPSFFADVTQNGEKIFTTDESWSATVGGPVRTADIWDGEYYDARLDGFDKISCVDYDLKKWERAKLADFFDGEVSEYIGPRVQVREELNLRAENITVYDGINYNGTNYGEVNVCATAKSFPVNLKKGQTVVVDLGQEMVGRANITFKGKKGIKVDVQYAEFLNDSGDIDRGNDGPKGSLYTINLRSALAKEVYIIGSDAAESYAPHFTFFGYRFISVTAEDDIEILDLVSEVVGSATKEIGKLETSNELVNKLISNALWGQRGNYLSVPTDCPQRDERYGWTGDTQAFSVTAAYNANVDGFFNKWLQDARDSQSEIGGYSDVIPRTALCSGENAAAWGDAGVIVCHNMYKLYNDIELVKTHYDSMEKYIAGLVEQYGMRGPNPRYGDWLAYDLCKHEYISSAYLVHDIDLMIEMSEAIGRDDRAEHYRCLRKQAHDYYMENFTKDGKPSGTTQTDKVLALAFDLLEPEIANEVADELVEQIKANGNRLSTGFVGTYLLCPTLSKFGKDGTAYSLVMQRNEPSWLYSVDQGATTIWERWNSYTKENGFGDVGMNSFNHYAYGSIVEWMYRYMAGIEAAEPGFEKLLLQPRVDVRTDEELPDGQQRMTSVKAEYESVAGKIESEWMNDNGVFTYKCVVPVLTELRLPILGDCLTVNGVEHSFDEYEVENKMAIVKLAPGEYCFEER